MENLFAEKLKFHKIKTKKMKTKDLLKMAKEDLETLTEL